MEKARKITRRGFFQVIGWFSFALLGLPVLWSCVRFFLPNVIYEKPSKFKAGFPGEYQVGTVSDRFKDRKVWMIRTKKGIYALSGTCTHLGCTPKFFKDEGIFKCPCHGSNFTREGENIAGPAPKPLARFQIGFADDGQILVDKSVKTHDLEEGNSGKFFLVLLRPSANAGLRKGEEVKNA